MITVNHQQGSQEWKDWRRTKLSASIAPEIMGKGYKSRSHAIQNFGKDTEVTPFLQELFDRGHRAEDAARPMACEIAQEELFPVAGEIEDTDFPQEASLDCIRDLSGKLTASFDGLDFERNIIWEHKLWKPKIQESIDKGEVPIQYRIQMEQQFMISGAERGLFMASDPDEDEMCYHWIEPDMKLRLELLDAWQLFLEDLESYLVVDCSEDAMWLDMERQLVTAEEELSVAKTKLENIRNAVTMFANGRRVIGKDYNVSTVMRAGNISYAKAFKELKIDADLEPFRGKSTEVVYIKRNK